MHGARTARKGRALSCNARAGKIVPQFAHIARRSRMSMLKLAYPRVSVIYTFNYLRQLAVFSTHRVNSFSSEVTMRTTMLRCVVTDRSNQMECACSSFLASSSGSKPLVCLLRPLLPWPVATVPGSTSLPGADSSITTYSKNRRNSG